MTDVAPMTRIGLAAEHESPEDPNASEIRVALMPAAVQRLVDSGREVAVESGAGAQVGFTDDDYRAAGASIVSREEVYRGRDAVVKLKGPTHAELATMDPGSLLVCMAHVRSVPQRGAICDERGINLLALELVTELPRARTESMVRGRLAMEQLLDDQDVSLSDLAIAFRGFPADTFGALQHAARVQPRSLEVLTGAADSDASSPLLEVDADRVAELAAAVADTDVQRGLGDVAPRRKIESLHLTGRAGAGHGVDLALSERDGATSASGLEAVVLGYGNVAFGATDELLRRGVRRVHVLTERTTHHSVIGPFLAQADVIVNGIDGHLQGHYVVTEDHLRTTIRPGTVIVDLVGGSASNRGAVEPIIECTAPTDPHTLRDGVYLSSVWGWPLVGFARESMERYSDQILRMLLTEEGVLDGHLPDGVRAGLVAGPLATDR